MRWTRKLEALGACEEAVEWAKESGHKTLAAAWAECPRGDWMLWLAGRVAGKPGSDSRRPLVLAACECARLTLPRFEERHPGDKRPRIAIEVTERWARGGEGAPSLEEVRSASYAAYATYAYAVYAAYATYADLYAAAAAHAAAYDARTETLSECADIVRKWYPKPPKEEA